MDRTDSAPQNSFSYYFESCTLLVLTARCCFKLKSNNLFKGKRKQDEQFEESLSSFYDSTIDKVYTLSMILLFRLFVSIRTMYVCMEKIYTFIYRPIVRAQFSL